MIAPDSLSYDPGGIDRWNTLADASVYIKVYLNLRTNEDDRLVSHTCQGLDDVKVE